MWEGQVCGKVRYVGRSGMWEGQVCGKVRSSPAGPRGFSLGTPVSSHKNERDLYKLK